MAIFDLPFSIFMTFNSPPC